MPRTGSHDGCVCHKPLPAPGHDVGAELHAGNEGGMRLQLGSVGAAPHKETKSLQ